MKKLFNKITYSIAGFLMALGLVGGWLYVGANPSFEGQSAKTSVATIAAADINLQDKEGKYLPFEDAAELENKENELTLYAGESETKITIRGMINNTIINNSELNSSALFKGFVTHLIATTKTEIHYFS